MTDRVPLVGCPCVLVTALRTLVPRRRAAPAGIRVCIEFMRFTEVKTLADVIEVANLVDEPNVGVLADLFACPRSGTTFEDSPEHGALRAVGFEALFDETVPFSLEVRPLRMRDDSPDSPGSDDPSPSRHPSIAPQTAEIVIDQGDGVATVRLLSTNSPGPVRGTP